MTDRFLRQYVETALWSSDDESTPQGGVPMDQNYGIEDVHPDSLARMAADCDLFWLLASDMVADDPEQAAHDFWLTRNGHGAGFWDGDWPEDIGEELTRIAQSFGEAHLIVGDDGLVHLM